jgi:alanine dehydrogenase
MVIYPVCPRRLETSAAVATATATSTMIIVVMALMSGVTVIIGGGVVGTNAAKMAAGLGARVTILDLSLERLRYLDDVLPKNVRTVYSNRFNILEAITHADLVVGAVLLPGAKAPNLIRREDLKSCGPSN